jgi:hypothetical protein
MIEGADILFRNFAGKADKYNDEGDRNFSVIIEDEVDAKRMEADGWNIKWLKDRETNEPEKAYLQIKVSYKGRPPTVVLISRRGRTTLTEDLLETLDWVQIKEVDLIFRPYSWTVRDASGIKAYLYSIYVVMDEDELMVKWGDVEEIHQPGTDAE